jgi:hypothetical protein
MCKGDAEKLIEAGELLDLAEERLLYCINKPASVIKILLIPG